jgi:hypothetical protein
MGYPGDGDGLLRLAFKTVIVGWQAAASQAARGEIALLPVDRSRKRAQ